MKNDVAKIDRILSRAVSEIIVESDLRKLLADGEPLRLKMGFDPSSPDIHIGHAVGLRKLRQFQDLGHKVILIVGDWTARIGDPSGTSATRRMLSQQEVENNAETYMQQLFKVLDKQKTEAIYQSEWFGKFDLEKIIRLTSKFTVAQFLAREDFSNRFQSQKPIAITELLYPLLQAYDSVAIQADVEFGGTDQKFNLLVGRQLQEMEGQKPQQILTVPILVGTDGVMKMSKSLGNYIGVDESPNEIFGKIMSVGDNLILSYFELLTDITNEDLRDMATQIKKDSINPMDLKKHLAQEIVTQFHNQSEAINARNYFEKSVQRGEMPDVMPVIDLSKVGMTSTDRLPTLLTKCNLAKSNSEAIRLIKQEAVRINGITVPSETIHVQIHRGDVIQVGKRRFVKILT
ncbi:MAG: tyrosyl-tRNA synthetase [Chloroflexi bacterium]|jgi:tyrosyl-tRNA synthetase|nr:MAG: tyrosyl-tRNA synthetase [Chloroflexota bacterium]